MGEFLRQALDSLFSGGPAYFAVALLLAGLVLLFRAYVGRKRLSFEEEFNSKIGIVPFARSSDPAASILAVFNSVSVVVLRVRNIGYATIEPEDYAKALRFVVQDRYIVDFRLSEPEPDTLRALVDRDSRVSARISDYGDPPSDSRARDALVAALPDSLLDPTAEHRELSRELRLPRLKLKRKDGFRLVVCLREDRLRPRDSETDKGYEFTGTLKPGKIIDQDAPRTRFSATRLLGAAVVTLLVLLVGAIAWRSSESPYCADGELRVVGSSAFRPAIEKLSAQYAQECGATFELAMDGSLDGVLDLADSTDPDVIAFSDGRAETDDAEALEGRPVAVLVLALVVNADTGVQDLTTAQIRAIHSGAVRNWAEVGGADLPIRLVSRDAASGTRRALERTVLDGVREGPVTSDDCLTADPGPGPVRCERSSTSGVLEQVADTSGAIGYADATSAADYPTVARVRIDGLEPTEDYLTAGYPFWAVEYAYTRGLPDPGSLPDGFVDYLRADQAALDLQATGYTPCVDSDGQIIPTCAAGS